MGKSKFNISDREFFSILRENAGLYARTARSIEKKFGISYTRQAVRDRAQSNPELVKDIQEENVDIAEEGLRTLMFSKNERVRLQAIEIYLKNYGRKRGYGGFEKDLADALTKVTVEIVPVK